MVDLCDCVLGRLWVEVLVVLKVVGLAPDGTWKVSVLV